MLNTHYFAHVTTKSVRGTRKIAVLVYMYTA